MNGKKYLDVLFVNAVALACVAWLVAFSCPPGYAQSAPDGKTVSQPVLSPAAVKALAEVTAATQASWEEVERSWRNVFREARSQKRLTEFVGETLDLFEKLRQVQDWVANPKATETRIGNLFRQRIMDEDAVCRLMEQSLANYARTLDEQDRTLLIKLKIDRDVARTNLSRSVIDPARFKQPIAAVISAAVSAAQRDIARSIAAYVAGEAIGAGVKKVAQDSGFLPGDSDPVADFIGGIIIDIGIGIVIDKVTDPTPQMVKDLEARLFTAERTILDGQGTTPGFLTTLRRLTQERILARRKLVLDHATK